MLHWLNVHLWAPMWPNMFAPSLITLAAVAVSHAWTKFHVRAAHLAAAALHREQLAQAEEHHKAQLAQLAAHCTDLKAHVNSVASKGDRM